MDPAPDRAREGLAHLQAAARELIEAARAALDVAEELVDDPEAVAAVVGSVGTLGALVRRRAASAASAASAAADGTGAAPADAGVEHITVV